MANRGRDFKVSILSDVKGDGFDRGGHSIEQLGDKAKVTAGQLNDSMREIDRTSDSLDDLGDRARSTASKVDGALDRIAKSSSSNLRKVDDDADKAGKGLDDFKDEASSTGREAAASFTGSFDDITSGIQEVAANAFAGFGPAGAAAGLVAAAGIGIITSALNAVKEKVDDVAESFRSLGADSIDNPADRLNAFFDTMDVDRLSRFRDGLDQAGISYADYFAAIAAGGPEQDAMTRRIQEAYDSAGPLKGALGGLVDENAYFVQGQEKGAEAAALQADAMRAAGADVEGYADAIGGIADGSGVMAAAIEDAATRQAAATKSGEDSWTDYKDTAVGSIDDVIAKQLEQLTAANNFQANTKTVLDRLGQDAVEWALSQGENADKAMQLLATAPLEKGQQVVANYRALGASSTASYAAGFTAGKPAALTAADEVRAEMRSRLSGPIGVPVNPQAPSAGELAAERARIAAGIGTVTVPLMLRNVTPSIWSTQRIKP